MFLIGSLPFSSSWACLQSAACRPAYSPRSGESRTGSILLSHGLAAVVSLVLELTFGIGEPSFYHETKRRCYDVPIPITRRVQSRFARCSRQRISVTRSRPSSGSRRSACARRRSRSDSRGLNHCENSKNHPLLVVR